MSKLYGEGHRLFQDQHDTRRLADRLESMSRAEFDESDREFIESAAMFFLSTVDERGMPTVSYKGGLPGFVRVTAPNEIVFPVYDGNGMFLSLGNIASTSNVGLLFIDFERPRRLRLQGTARVLTDDSMTRDYPGAQHLTVVTVSSIYANCGRYIHKTGSSQPSAHVPDKNGQQPFPLWKRIDKIADSLSEDDRREVMKAGGLMAIESYQGEDPPGNPRT
jgi:uncharacterized protein